MENFDDFAVTDGTCLNYAVNNFNATFNCNSKNFMVINFNIQSFDSKIDEFSAFLHEIKLNPEIIILTETWFSPLTCRDITGYKGYHCTRPNINARGGISIYVLNNLNLSLTHYSSNVSAELEYVHITLKPRDSNGKNIDIVGIYRPPYRPLVDDFFISIEAVLNNLGTGNNQIVGGDFNICGLAPSPVLDKYIDLLRSFAFVPHINKITRPNQRGNDSCIDHIWSNFGFTFKSGVFNEVIISDHFISFVFFSIKTDTSFRKIEFRDHSETNILNMIDKLTNFKLFFPLLTATLDLNAKFNLFHDELIRIYKTCCPIKTKLISEKRLKKPWLSNQLLGDIRKKYDLFKRFKNGAIPYDQFSTYQNELKRKIKNAKKQYFLNKFASCRGDSSKTWKLTNNILGRSSKSKKPTSLMHNNSEITDETRLCNIFNEYFVNIGKNLALKIPDNSKLKLKIFIDTD